MPDCVDPNPPGPEPAPPAPAPEPVYKDPTQCDFDIAAGIPEEESEACIKEAEAARLSEVISYWVIGIGLALFVIVVIVIIIIVATG